MQRWGHSGGTVKWVEGMGGGRKCHNESVGGVWYGRKAGEEETWVFRKAGRRRRLGRYGKHGVGVRSGERQGKGEEEGREIRMLGK